MNIKSLYCSPFQHTLFVGFPVLMRTLLLVFVAITFIGCTDVDFPGSDIDTPQDSSVSITSMLTGTGIVNTRATLSPSDVFAYGETSKTTAITPFIFLPAYLHYNGDKTQASKLVSGTVVNDNNLMLTNPNATGGADNQLYMKHLTLNTTKKTAGLVFMPNSSVSLVDLLYSNTTSTQSSKSSVYSFILNHVLSKMSVLVVDPSGSPITTVTNMKVTNIPLAYYNNSSDISITPKITLNKEGHCIISTKYNTSLTEYMFRHPKSTGSPWGNSNAPSHLWNIILPPYYSNDESILIKDMSNNTVPNGIDISSAILEVTLAANPADNMPAHTYKLKFGNIGITGLASGDPRVVSGSTGKLKHTINNEHIIITVIIDEKVLINGTATVGDWQTAQSTGNIGDPSTGGSLI